MSQSLITGLPDEEFFKINKEISSKKYYDFQNIHNWYLKYKESPFISSILAYYYCDKKEIDSAKKVLSNIHLNDNTFILGALAYIDLKESKKEDAIIKFNKSIESDSLRINQWSRFYLSQLYNEIDSFKAHEMLLDLLELYPDFAMGITELAILKSKEGQFKEAIELLLKQVNLDSTDADIYYFIAENYLKMKNYESADKYFDKTIALSPIDPLYTPLISSYIGKGRIQFSFIHDKIKAEEYYLNALELSNNKRNVLTIVGYFYIDIEDFIKAEHYFKKADKIKPILNNSMGLLFSLISQIKYNEALKFVQTQNEFSDSHQMIFYKIIIYSSIGQNENAQKEVDHLISTASPDDLRDTLQQLRNLNINIDYH